MSRRAPAKSRIKMVRSVRTVLLFWTQQIARGRSKNGAAQGLDFIIAVMAHQITLIPGDGIGPEVAEATVRAVDATGVAVEWERVEAGARALAEQGQLIPDDVF